MEGCFVEEEVLYRRTFCTGGRFEEGHFVEGCLVEGCFVGRTFCSEGRFVEGRFVLAPFLRPTGPLPGCLDYCLTRVVGGQSLDP